MKQLNNLSFSTRKDIQTRIDDLTSGSISTRTIDRIVDVVLEGIDVDATEVYTFEDYIKDAMRTCPEEIRTLGHGIDGVATEAGELMDIIKKNRYYNKSIDVVNLAEEVGDIMWYIALICETAGLNFTDILKINISKLKKRYPEKFTVHYALNRNLTKEREGLENDMGTTITRGEIQAVHDKTDVVDKKSPPTDGNISPAG